MREVSEPEDTESAVDRQPDLVPSLLAEMPLEGLDVLGPGAPAPSPGDRKSWVAEVNESGCVTRLTNSSPGPGRALALDDVVTAPDSMTIHHLVRTWAFLALGDPLPRGAALIVRRSDALIGVLAGENLAEIAYAGSVRAIIDALPLVGRVEVPVLTRRCRYVSGPGQAVRCSRTESFSEYPDAFPECPAAPGIPAHTFTW